MKANNLEKALTSDEITKYIKLHYHVSYVSEINLDKLIEFISYFKLSDLSDIDCVLSALDHCPYFYGLAYKLNDYNKTMEYLHYYYVYSFDVGHDESHYLEYLLELMEIDSCVAKVLVGLLSENPNPDLMSQIIDMVEFHLVEGYRIYVYKADLRKHLYVLP